MAQSVVTYGIMAMVLATVLMAPGVELFVGADGRFRPSGSSYGWDRWIIGIHLISDLTIGLSYIAISGTLLYLARKAREDIPFLWVFVAFGVFIIACGFTHFAGALTVWTPVFWASGAIKVVTALASIITAVAVPPLVPKILALIHLAKAGERQKAELIALKDTLEALLSERTAAFAVVEHRALHDALTEMPNRVLLYDRLQQALHAGHRENGAVALLLLDLDGFKNVNDELGHSVGDQLLQHVAARIQATLRESDTAARLGGDEFAILLPTEGQEGAEAVARKLITEIGEPYEFAGHHIPVRASVGVAVYPQHGTGVETLVQHADVAMYEAKRGGLGTVVYSPDRDQSTNSRLAVIARLGQAIAHDELVLHFQPKLSLTDHSVHNVEALIRWQHPERGLLGPDQFIPIAEELGFMQPLTCWVIGAALKQCSIWRDAGVPLNVAVNLSAADLKNPTLSNTISDYLAAYCLDPSSLTVEITETTVMDQREMAVSGLRALRALGVRISIDDFGVGYASLSHLVDLPLDELKLDRSFVRGMTSKAPEYFISHAVLDLGRNMGLSVVAEGVEDDAALSLLTSLQCDQAQGYGIARPMPADALLPWVRDLRAGPHPRTRSANIQIGPAEAGTTEAESVDAQPEDLVTAGVALF